MAWKVERIEWRGEDRKSLDIQTPGAFEWRHTASPQHYISLWWHDLRVGYVQFSSDRDPFDANTPKGQEFLRSIETLAKVRYGLRD